MKKMIFCAAIMMGFAAFANAQSTDSTGSDNTTQKSDTTARKINSSSQSKAKPAITNNRVLFKSKRTKQVATPTGQQATGTNGAHANNPKNAGKSDE